MVSQVVAKVSLGQIVAKVLLGCSYGILGGVARPERLHTRYLLRCRQATTSVYHSVANALAGQCKVITDCFESVGRVSMAHRRWLMRCGYAWTRVM